MKKLYLVSFTILTSLLVNGQLSIGASYSLSVPLREMGDNINPLHSLNVSGLYPLKGWYQRIAIGAELGLGNYAYVTKEQDLRFSDGSGFRSDVVYASNVVNAALLVRANLLPGGKAIPYLTAKGGISHFFSNITIGDPQDGSSCEPVESRNIINDNTLFVSYGGGVQFDLSLFSKKQRLGEYIIDIGINNITGGRLNYINTKNIHAHVETDPNNPAPATGKGEPLNVQFINITTRSIHEHQVAELYNSPLRMLDFRLGMLFKLN